jgi:hypothetical protein
MNPVPAGGNVCCTGNAAGRFSISGGWKRVRTSSSTREAFKEGTEVSGPITRRVRLADARIPDFTVKVLDVYPTAARSISTNRFMDALPRYKPLAWMNR